MILLYDASTTKWSEQMVLGTDATASSSEGFVPMEIDRVQSKGTSKSGKSKTKDRSGYKGKSMGKEKGKDHKGKGKFRWPRGLVGIEASSDPLTHAGGGSNPHWSTGKSQDFQRPG